MISTCFKYPRTFHFPWSDGVNSDDKVIPSLDQFKGRRVVVTKKMDGENTSIYRHNIHARSLDGRHHVSRDWIKSFWSNIRHEIPENWRICGENLFAKHSIHYKDLKSYFYGFSIWNDENIRLNWDETSIWFELLGIQSVQVLYNDSFDEKRIFDLKTKLGGEDEGFVMTIADDLAYSDFSLYTVKYVRANHVQTSSHWKREAVIQNNLRCQDVGK